jgi:hypothetical protein
MSKLGSDTKMLRACVWEWVIGLVKGKTAGSVFLSLPMVSANDVIIGYSRYPCLLKQLQELNNNFHIVLFLKTPIYRVTLMNIKYKTINKYC